MKPVFFGLKAVPCTGKSGPESNRRGVFCYEQNHHPANYTPALNLYDTQRAIGTVKRLFADTLCATLNLYRVSAPLFLEASTGLNDDLNGVERKVTFDIKESGIEAQVVQSLAKWKRKALKDYDFRVGKGLYCDMNAIRRDEDLDNLHSIYVDQWDWEKVIRLEDRNEAYLKSVVRSIVSAVCATEMNLHAMFPQLQELPLHSPNVTFITTQELEDQYPDLTPKERENAFVKEHGTTFLMKIGAPLKSGKPHDGRAPDYDDWDLNGDLLFWNDPLQCSYELSSMGIRVSPESMDKQLTMAGCDDRRALPFHKAVLNGELPYSIGGGIGQSACACCCWAAPTLAKCRPASGTQPPAKPAPRQASRCCKQVFHTKIQKAGYHPHGDTLPLFVFCRIRGEIVRVLYHHQTNPQTNV